MSVPNSIMERLILKIWTLQDILNTKWKRENLII